MGGVGGSLSSPGSRNLRLQQSMAQISQLLPVFLPFLHGKLTEVFMENRQDSAPPSSALDVGPQGPAPTHSTEEMQKGSSSCQEETKSFKNHPQVSC